MLNILVSLQSKSKKVHDYICFTITCRFSPLLKGKNSNSLRLVGTKKTSNFKLFVSSSGFVLTLQYDPSLLSSVTENDRAKTQAKMKLQGFSKFEQVQR